jgi:hypothetical protein
MPALKEIPGEVKWKYAAQCAATLPAMYDIAFSRTLGKKYEALEQEIWMELARSVQTIAHDLSLPVSTAHELAQSIRTATTILFGPEYGSEALELSGDNVVIIIKRCPFLIHGHMPAADHAHAFSRCMALTLTAVPLLNKKYAARFVRTMCTGDRQCEIKIEIKPEPEKKPEDK